MYNILFANVFRFAIFFFKFKFFFVFFSQIFLKFISILILTYFNYFYILQIYLRFFIFFILNFLYFFNIFHLLVFSPGSRCSDYPQRDSTCGKIVVPVVLLLAVACLLVRTGLLRWQPTRLLALAAANCVTHFFA